LAAPWRDVSRHHVDLDPPTLDDGPSARERIAARLDAINARVDAKAMHESVEGETGAIEK
jgi:hypothetical protein